MKSSKETADYKENGSGTHRCAYCTMFRAPHACSAVKGSISPCAVCKYYKRSYSKSKGEHLLHG